MNDVGQPRRVRADAQQSSVRILEAARTILTADPNASLEQVADAAGVARATVHRRFSSRQSLFEALAQDLNARYRHAFEQARVKTAPPMVALHRLTELAFALKVSHPFVAGPTHMVESPVAPQSDPAIHAGLDLLFTRLYTAGEIISPDPTWGRHVYIALLHVVYELPMDSTTLGTMMETPGDDAGARVDLLVRTLIGALGGQYRQFEVGQLASDAGGAESD